MDVRFEGTLTAVEPIHISQPEQETPGVCMVPVFYGDEERHVPCIPGGTFKGLVRSRAGEITHRSYMRTPSLDDYYLVFKGGIKGSEKEANLSFAESMAYRESHPILGLFGSAAPYWLKGRVQFGHLRPVTPDQASVVQFGGVRRDDFRLDPARLAILSEKEQESYAAYVLAMRKVSALRNKEAEASAAYRRVKKAADANKSDLAAAREVDRVGKELSQIRKDIEEAKQDDDFANTVGRPLDAVNAIGPGSRFRSGIVALGLTDAEAGLLVETLRSLAGNCRIGGKAANGFGDFRADWEISVRDDDFCEWKEAGRLTVEQGSAEYRPQSEALDKAVQAWERLAQEKAKAA